MGFWGIEIKPGKPYAHNFDHSRGRLRISQATLGDGKSESKTTVQCNVGDSSPISLCTLIPKISETCHLELEFEEDKEVIFSVLGPRSIHLTGYYPGYVRPLDGDDSESYGEDIAEYDTSDSYTGDSEDEYESDFIDDDEMCTDFPAHKSNVVIEEIEDDDKPHNTNGKLRRLKKKQGVSETGSKQLVVMKTESSIEESEDEDGFPISFTAKRRSSKKKINDDKESKFDGNSHDNVSVSEANENHDSTISAETAFANNGKLKKNKKKGGELIKPNGNAEADEKSENTSISVEKVHEHAKENLKGANIKEKLENGNLLIEEIQEHVKEILDGAKDTGNDGGTAINSDDLDISKMSKTKDKKKRTREEGMSNGKISCEYKIDADKLARDDNSPIDKKKKGKKSKKKNSDSNIDDEASAIEKKDAINGVDGSRHESQSIQTRTFPNGFIVEEVSMGKPEGKKASQGKKVSVHYIGKLKNGKIFDSNIGQSPFKFRLGINEVIKGWDIGIKGMRVGDKRRLTIPPSLGYGAKGAGKIPPNSWLVFDVELVDVH